MRARPGEPFCVWRLGVGRAGWGGSAVARWGRGGERSGLGLGGAAGGAESVGGAARGGPRPGVGRPSGAVCGTPQPGSPRLPLVSSRLRGLGHTQGCDPRARHHHPAASNAANVR